MKKFNSILFLLFITIGIYAQDLYHEKINSYTQLLLTEWELLKNDGKTLESFQNDVDIKSEISRSQSLFDLENTLIEFDKEMHIKGFIKTAHGNCDDILKKYNVQFSYKSGNIYACDIPFNVIENLLHEESVISIEAARPAELTMDSARRVSNIDQIHIGALPLNKEYKGTDVIVGMVDVGFDFTHPNFYDPSGNRYRIKKVWCQNDSKSTSDVAYGATYENEDEIKIKRTDAMAQNHGSHTAGIAAGGGYTTPYMGVAPESDIVLVGTNLYTKGILDGIAFIIDYAKSVNKPCVINLSLGSKLGPKDGTSSEDIMIDNMIGPGVIVVGSSGNCGEMNMHINKVFNGTGTDTLRTFINPEYGYSSCYTDIWEREKKPFYIQVQILETATDKVVYESAVVNVANSSKVYTANTENNIYSIYFMNQKNASNGNYNCLLYAYARSKSFSSKEYIIIKVFSEDKNEINIWGDKATYISRGKSGFTPGDNKSTMLALGGVGKEIISVGAFSTKNKWTSLSGIDQYFSGNLYEVAKFSSRGPTADKRIKPDISAPGYGVASSYNSYCSTFGENYPYTVAKATFKGRTYYWGMDLGTSMSAPIITGTIALWLENNPNLTPGDVRDILSYNSFNSTMSGKPTKDIEYGWGKIDAFAGLKESIAMNIDVVKSRNKDLKIIVDSDLKKLSVFSEKNILSCSVCDMGGRQILSISKTDNFNFSNDDEIIKYDIDISDIEKGVYIINVRGINLNESSKFMIK